ncbi:haloacid dehalogenase superfamily, subfamily IA, variant 3 with third motif having DD or ED [Rhizobium sp. RU20A]|uniref:HAD family hydrolase n=1 Tax=Rhizobium sp. RU20A TaxID=1907412 RepID=UPI0009567079|nr:HAD family hydrolase [Rhizobium sp. RU20A]SIQ31249.1 haloacid dehalogenase superfamily, subfamily IA, variant 3 with third motif having DD or ED [Rhizobium sp. RU20A]
MDWTPPQLVIFDCDGVLVDSEPISMGVMLSVLAEAGVAMTTEEATHRFLGRSMKTIIEILHQDFGLKADEAMLEAMRARLYDRFRAELQPVEGIAEAIDGLPVPHCVASSSQPERIRLSLGVTGLLDRFEPNIFSATMVANGKPAPDLFLHASNRMGVAPADCVVIEDSPAGIAAAQAAGMRVFAFAGAGHSRNDRHRSALAELQPDLLFDDMRALVHLVREKQVDGTSL